jgi:hypothetical protein
MSYNGTCEPKKILKIILKIVLEEHIVQLIILLDKRTEIYLNDRK